MFWKIIKSSKRILCNNTIKIRTALVAVLLFAIINGAFSQEVSGVQSRLSEEIVRFHIRANSDSKEDQNLKLKVKEAVVTYMEDLLEGAKDSKESASRIEDNMEDLLMCAMEVIHEEGYEYDLKGYLVKEYFPMKMYGDVCMPAGEYTAFRIDIGNASGKNWWCVLYPPLCFVDVTCAVVPEESKKKIEEIVKEEESQNTYSVEFKYLKFLNKYIE